MDTFEKRVESLHQNQSLLAEIALHLNDTVVSQEKVDHILQQVGTRLHVSRTYIFEHDFKNRTTNNTFEWCAQEIAAQKDELQGIPFDMITEWLDMLENDGVIYSEDIQELPDNIRAILEPQGILSLVVYPLVQEGSIFGFIGFDECSYHRSWEPEELDVLKIIAGIISSQYKQNSMQEKLIERERNFRSFFETVKDFIFIGDLQGNCIFANPAVTEKLKYSREDVLSMNILDFHPKEYHSEAQQIIEEMFAGKREYCPVPLQIKGGGHIPVETRVWFGEWNGEQALFGISKDLSEQQASLDRFNKLFHNNPTPMAVSRADNGELIDVNAAFEQAVQYTREDVIGNTAENLGIFLDPEKRRRLGEKLKNNKEVINEHMKIRKRSGEIIDGIFSGTLIDNQGEQHFLTTMVDISDRIRWSRRIEQQNRRMENILEATNAGSWEWNVQTGETVFDERWASLIGYSLEELGEITIETWKNFVHQDDGELGDKLLKKHFSGEIPFYSCECRVRHKDGHYVWVEDKGKVIEWADDGTPVLMFGTHSDISERKRMEHDVQKAKERAEYATKVKSDFLATMSHEIRTPINTIIGMNTLLQQTRMGDQQRRYIDRIFSASQILLQTVNNVLDFSQIEANKLKIQQNRFSLEQLVQELVNSFSSATAQKGLNFFVSLELDLPLFLQGDSFRLLQVLQNLLSNAVKFTSQGSVSLDITPIKYSEETVHIQFSVKDTGIGFNQETKDKLFEAFSQAEGSISRNFGGSGLGLAICRNLVKIMGGSIHVQSSPGKGSLFRLILPFRLEEKKRFTDKYRQLQSEDKQVVFVQQGAQQGALQGAQKGPDEDAVIRNLLKKLEFDFSLVDADGEDPEAGELRIVPEEYLQGEGAGRETIILMDWDVLKKHKWMISRFSQEECRYCTKIIMVSVLQDETAIIRAMGDNPFKVLRKPVLPGTLSRILNQFYQNTGKPNKKFQPEVMKKDLASEEDNSYAILLCEDHEVNREMMKELLEGAGYHVTAATNGWDAVRLADTIAFDLMLLDIQMPGLDGYATAERIRKLSKKQARKMPILAVTAHVLEKDRKKSMEAGMNGFLTKPIQPQYFFETIAYWLGQSSEGSEGSEAPAVLRRKTEGKESRELGKGEAAMEKLASSAGSLAERIQTRADEISRLYHIDAPAALARVGWNVDLYEKLLQSFLEDYSDFTRMLQSELEMSQLQEAAKRIHAVRGLVGNLGFTELYEALLDFEQFLKEHYAYDEAMLKRLDSLSEQFSSGISSSKEFLTVVDQERKEAETKNKIGNHGEAAVTAAVSVDESEIDEPELDRDEQKESENSDASDESADEESIDSEEVLAELKHSLMIGAPEDAKSLLQKLKKRMPEGWYANTGMIIEEYIGSYRFTEALDFLSEK